ncbi:hypothetical protein NUU61_003421 [Penicillium alfredii]|uniref:non-reducing end alpha-L-arabinofuranosidase n=1 Tax=Penicillium alfredii TaxID=1506179 RepID=A0A9W9FTG9_9EURO|nr:uncharacterized protein NUU61_003421 [Penicillium alfredii]KAJ5106074.1 hypothetical protein NUU61_003421 [Penicillium alfredii]
MVATRALDLTSGLATLSLLCGLFGSAKGVSLEVSTEGGNSSSPLLYGFMFEDINHSGDGGIYAQLLRNNGLQGSKPDLTAWGSVGNSKIAVDSDNPLTSAITHTLRVDVPKEATGRVGVTNAGYWGIPVDGSNFHTSFWIKGKLDGDITARLVGNGTGTEYASKSISVSSNGNKFTVVDASFETTKAPDGNVYYELTVDGKSVAGSSLYFGLVQLFPRTYKDRQNGLQPKLANALESVKGSFLRFPGGNNLEGDDGGSRWKWNETIGPVEDRPGRQGTWTYPNTDGLGLDEYFYWCEDMGLEPVLDVWAGFALQSGGNTPITGDALKPYVDDVLNELEYVLGDKSTKYGALRASYGRDDPWPLKMVEIGNEDNLGGGCQSYSERFTAFYDAVHKAYPDLTLIASTSEKSCLPSSMPKGAWMDYHDYNSPDGLVGQFNYFDNSDRSVPYFIGEYAQNGVDWPIMQGSVAEAVFMIGLERNSDVVKMAAYAPLLQLTNSTQWKPNLIGYTQSPTGLVETSSYFVQEMFSVNRGDTIKKVTSDLSFGPVYWVASSAKDAYFVKLANYGSKTQDISIAISGKNQGKLTVVADDDAKAANTDTETPIAPTDSTVSAKDGKFTFTLPAWSVAVLAAS